MKKKASGSPAPTVNADTLHPYLATGVEVAGYTILPPTLATQILLEEIDHPILRAATAGSEDDAAKVSMGGRDILNLIFIFAKTEEAMRTMGMSRDNFAAAARTFAMNLPPSAVPEMVAAIKGMLVAMTPPLDPAGGAGQ